MTRLARATGILLQGLVMGTLLFIAILRLLATLSGASVFRYQGF